MTLFQNHFTTIRPSKQVLLASVLFREIVSLKYNLDLFFTWLLVPFYLTDVLPAWRNTFIFISQLHTSINSIIIEGIATAQSTITTHPIVFLTIIIHVSALIQFMLKQKTQPLNYNWKLFFHSGIASLIFPESMISVNSVSSLAKHIHIVHTNRIRKRLDHS